MDILAAIERLRREPHTGSIVNLVRFFEDRQPDFSYKNKTTDEIKWLVGRDATAELFIVEHVDAQFIDFLRGYYKERHPDSELNLRFLHDHLDSGPWFTHDFKNIDEYIPRLHSRTIDLHHANFRVLTTRPFKKHNCLHHETRCLEGEPGTSRPGLYAVSMDAFHKKEKCEIPAVALVRHHFTAWCDAKDGTPWTLSVILLDPPFKLGRQCGHPDLTHPRHYDLCPNISCAAKQATILQSYRTELTHHMEKHSRFQRGTPHPLLILRDLFQIVASEWMATLAFFTRDLDHIESAMEARASFSGAAGMNELQRILNRLVLVRRRIKGYDAVIEQQRAICEFTGQIGLGTGSEQTDAELVSQATASVRADYDRVRGLVKENIMRTDQDLNFATSFTSIEHGKAAIVEGERAATRTQMTMILTFIATFFLPINAIAAILNMTGDYGPGHAKFSIFWAISVPIALSMVVGLATALAWGVACVTMARYKEVEGKTQ